MARMKDGLRTRKCGCVYYEYGPPLKCQKHRVRGEAAERKQYRDLVGEKLNERGHDLTRWEEYDSQAGKWTAYCKHCGQLVIVYDQPPAKVDQVISEMLKTPSCQGGLTRYGQESTSMEQSQGYGA